MRYYAPAKRERDGGFICRFYAYALRALYNLAEDEKMKILLNKSLREERAAFGRGLL